MTGGEVDSSGALTLHVHVLGHEVVQPSELFAQPFAVYRIVAEEPGREPACVVRRWSELKKLLHGLVKTEGLDMGKMTHFEAHAGMRIGPMTLDPGFLDVRVRMMQSCLSVLVALYVVSLVQPAGPAMLRDFLSDGATPLPLAIPPVSATAAFPQLVASPLVEADEDDPPPECASPLPADEAIAPFSPQSWSIDKSAASTPRGGSSPVRTVEAESPFSPRTWSLGGSVGATPIKQALSPVVEGWKSPLYAATGSSASTVSFHSDASEVAEASATPIPMSASPRTVSESKPSADAEPPVAPAEREVSLPYGRSSLALASLAACALLALAALLATRASPFPSLSPSPSSLSSPSPSPATAPHAALYLPPPAIAAVAGVARSSWLHALEPPPKSAAPPPPPPRAAGVPWAAKLWRQLRGGEEADARRQEKKRRRREEAQERKEPLFSNVEREAARRALEEEEKRRGSKGARKSAGAPRLIQSVQRLWSSLLRRAKPAAA